MTRLAATLAAVLALQAGAGETVRVDSALLRTPDAGVLEVGPGLYLPEASALDLATELRGCRERPAAATAPPPAPVPTGVVTALVVGLLVGVVAGGAAVLAVTR